MKNIALFIITCLLALCASTAGAQVIGIVGTRANYDQQAVFGGRNVNHGGVQIITGTEKFTIPSVITFKVRECSLSPVAAIPFTDFTLTVGASVYQGFDSWVDQERVVSFRTGGIQEPNTTSTYLLRSNVVDYPSSYSLDKQCFRMVLERTGFPTKVQLNANFPIRLGAKTLVRSKPTVTITPIGATTNRVRMVSDDVFLLSVSADTTYEILIKEIAPHISGSAPNGGHFQVVDHDTGTVIGIGDLSGQANISFQYSAMFGEYFVSPGASRSFRIRVDSSIFPNNPGSESFSLQLPNPCDFQWDTSPGNAGGPGLCLEQQVVPITATVSYE